MTDSTLAREVAIAAAALNAAVQRAAAAGVQVQLVLGPIFLGGDDHQPYGPLQVGEFYRVTRIQTGISEGGEA